MHCFKEDCNSKNIDFRTTKIIDILLIIVNNRLMPSLVEGISEIHEYLIFNKNIENFELIFIIHIELIKIYYDSVPLFQNCVQNIFDLFMHNKEMATQLSMKFNLIYILAEIMDYYSMQKKLETFRKKDLYLENLKKLKNIIIKQQIILNLSNQKITEKNWSGGKILRRIDINETNFQQILLNNYCGIAKRDLSEEESLNFFTNTMNIRKLEKSCIYILKIIDIFAKNSENYDNIILDILLIIDCFSCRVFNFKKEILMVYSLLIEDFLLDISYFKDESEKFSENLNFIFINFSNARFYENFSTKEMENYLSTYDSITNIIFKNEKNNSKFLVKIILFKNNFIKGK